jgi:hypothetical protein
LDICCHFAQVSCAWLRNTVYINQLPKLFCQKISLSCYTKYYSVSSFHFKVREMLIIYFLSHSFNTLQWYFATSSTILICVLATGYTLNINFSFIWCMMLVDFFLKAWCQSPLFSSFFLLYFCISHVLQYKAKKYTTFQFLLHFKNTHIRNTLNKQKINVSKPQQIKLLLSFNWVPEKELLNSHLYKFLEEALDRLEGTMEVMDSPTLDYYFFI